MPPQGHWGNAAAQFNTSLHLQLGRSSSAQAGWWNVHKSPADGRSAGELPPVRFPFVHMLEDSGLVCVVGLLVSKPASSASLLQLPSFTAVDIWRTAELRRTSIAHLNKSRVATTTSITALNSSKGYAGRRRGGP